MNNFILFGTEHILIIIAGIILSLLFLIIGGLTNKKIFGEISALAILILKLAELSYRHLVEGQKIIDLLPLHLCNIALFFVIIMMFTHSKKLFQLCFFWSMGAIFAIITPDVKIGLPNFVTFSFFITHFYIIFGVIYEYIFFRRRPKILGYISSFVILNIIAVIIYFINDYLGTNYLFVNRMPNFSSPLRYFGQWPYYIIVVELIYIILGYLLYLPFKAKNIKYGKGRY